MLRKSLGVVMEAQGALQTRTARVETTAQVYLYVCYNIICLHSLM